MQRQMEDRYLYTEVESAHLKCFEIWELEAMATTEVNVEHLKRRDQENPVREARVKP